MTPKESALELFNKFLPILGGIEKKDWIYFRGEEAKQCALVAVNEILNSFSNVFDDFVIESSKVGGYRNMKKYWEEVKKEIEKI